MKYQFVPYLFFNPMIEGRLFRIIESKIDEKKEIRLMNMGI